MELEDLKVVADALRRDSLISTSAAESGHATSCLSCAEIMSALFFHQMNYDVKNPDNPDNDEFVMSKGHAAPILYSALSRAGCIKDNLKDLRKLKSNLEGHPMPNSLKWVKVATGSLGQGLSVGVGMALAAKLSGRKYLTYVLLGDGEIAEGSVYEALEFAKKYSITNLCAIVDCNRLGQSGESIEGHNTEAYKRRFEAFGWRTVSVDGHNIAQIINAISSFRSSRQDRPLAIIAKTIKGKGVSFLENQEGWHGKALDKKGLKAALKEISNKKFPKFSITKPEMVQPEITKPERVEVNAYFRKGRSVATREAYGKSLAKIASKDMKIIAIDGDVSNSTKSEEVRKVRPHQFLNAFIAEQNMIGVALGLSIKGFNPFASTFSAFLSRAFDQIRMASISHPRNNITICGSHSGVSIGSDGASQMGLEDISLFRTLPKSTIFYPSDASSTQKIVEMCASKIRGIKYIRTTRPETPVIYDEKEKFEVGKFKVVKESNKDTGVIIGAGITLHEAIKSQKELKSKGINVAVVDLYCIKPLDFKKLSEFIEGHGRRALVVEDHHPEGGIGEMIRSNIDNRNLTIESLSVKEVPHSGSMEELMKKYGIDSKSITDKIAEMVR